ncbi:MAG: energy-coupling factor transport system ATP-binding protein [Clostridia bacterium]|nr:energy-coupling factor transport system ATP-binding protein [Clostridia bacterium]
MEIKLKEVSFAYQLANRKVLALDNIDLTVSAGEFIAIVGAGGSGKSTLAQVLAGLLAPISGQVSLNGNVVKTRNKFKGHSPWEKVGIVFQQPEHQLFAETVYEDVAFGLKNMGYNGAEVKTRVKKALEAVGLDEKEIGYKSPFALSGGQQRRVAIAGILAMEPEVLILDEPTAGLDPVGREQIMELIRNYQKQQGAAIVLISHDMAEVATMAQQVIVLYQGKIALKGPPRDIFYQEELLRKYGLLPPPLTQLMLALKRFGASVSVNVLTLEEAEASIVEWLKGGNSSI